MKLEELPYVRIDLRTGADEQKYVVVVIRDVQGPEKKVLWGWRARRLTHSDLVGNIWEALDQPNFDINCIGGGWLKFDELNKKIELWGHSVTFGREPDRAESARMIKESFPAYAVGVV